MNEKILSYLKREGFMYLWRKFGEHAYKPMKGILEQLLAQTSTTPLWEDDLLSIDDALLLVGTESVQDDWTVLVKKKRGK
ncbi:MULTISPECIES: hypothetical protein [Sphingobacterium]|uniref:hypothetical protein n=1 Tax=Sphingobacterium TaxID=28453 RepID=UPI0009681DC4|nr:MULTISPECIES: hypothetical protein [Sphingobacterium]OJY99981.1 MAG: hypothetical protein BGP15_14835 [Sphingobacterium sp. 40-24]